MPVLRILRRPGLLKEVPNAPGTHSDKHLLEFRSRCLKAASQCYSAETGWPRVAHSRAGLQEGDASLASNGTGEQRLASSRRAGHHHALTGNLDRLSLALLTCLQALSTLVTEQQQTRSEWEQTSTGDGALSKADTTTKTENQTATTGQTSCTTQA